MKPNQFVKTRVGIGAFAIAMLMSGCLDKENLYNPDQGKNELPPESELFDFKLKGEIKLSVNYNAPGYKAIIEIYDEYPMDAENPNVKKKGIEPVYGAYTDSNGKFEGTIIVPTGMSEAYAYTDKWGLPQCVELELSKTGATYDSSSSRAARSSNAVSRASSRIGRLEGTKLPYKYRDDLGETNLYSICGWDRFFYFTDPDGYLTKTTEVTRNSKKHTIAAITNRADAYFKSYTDKGLGDELITKAGETNISVTEDGTTLDIIFILERAAYNNTFGYYYYPKGKKPTDMSKVKKYVVAPNASLSGTSFWGGDGNTIRLKYFGENGDLQASDAFPKDYEVAWFYIRNGASEAGNLLNDYGSLKSITFSGNRANFNSSNNETNRRFVLMKDAASGILVLGLEDSETIDPTDDYCDLIFFVNSNKNIEAGDVIPDETPEEKPGTLVDKGTLAFEDTWPGGGDYDLNDVIVEYNRAATFDGNNKVTQIVETFTPVQPAGSATYSNFFAYQVSNVGSYTFDDGKVGVETTTNSFYIKSDVKTVKGQAFSVTRTFGTPMDKNTIIEDFNPYIIVGSYKPNDRTEVHLPKHKATSAANSALIATQKDAYYIDIDERYPFAINVPVLGFTPVTEKVRIDKEYPDFAKWAAGNGNEKWYENYKGK